MTAKGPFQTKAFYDSMINSKLSIIISEIWQPPQISPFFSPKAILAGLVLRQES